MKMMRILLACLAALLAAGCLSSGERSVQRYFVLEDAGAATRSKVPRTSVLLVAPTTTSAFYDTQDIAYSRAAGSRAYYQFNAWTERPGRAFDDLLVARLDGGAAFRGVAKATSGVQGGLLLNVHLAEFYHDAATDPGNARIVLTAELLDAARRTLIGRRTFTRTAPVATYDAAGAVRAFNQAAGAILGDVAAWVDDVAPR